jgi:hypothetical protein
MVNHWVDGGRLSKDEITGGSHSQRCDGADDHPQSMGLGLARLEGRATITELTMTSSQLTQGCMRGS